jgi:predicted Fe-Mo cluster-binding NifX family protein
MDNSGLSAEISMHFGKSPYFAILKVENNRIEEVKVLETLGRHGGGNITPAEMLVQSNADILLCANLGSKAIKMLRDERIKILVGATGNVNDTFEKWKSDNLRLADENSVCKESSQIR